MSRDLALPDDLALKIASWSFVKVHLFIQYLYRKYKFDRTDVTDFEKEAQ